MLREKDVERMSIKLEEEGEVPRCRQQDDDGRYLVIQIISLDEQSSFPA